MNFRRRYERLTFWNKFAFWGSAASIIGLLLPLIGHFRAPTSASRDQAPNATLTAAFSHPSEPDFPVFRVSSPEGTYAWSSRLVGVRPGDHVSFLIGIKNMGRSIAHDASARIKFAYASTEVTAKGEVLAPGAVPATGTARVVILPGFTNVRFAYVGGTIVEHSAGERSIDASMAESGAGVPLGSVSPGNAGARWLKLEYKVVSAIIALQ